MSSPPTSSSSHLPHRPAVPEQQLDSASPASPAPLDPNSPVAADSPSTPGDATASGEQEAADLPMTMAASVMLTSLPRDARSALEGAGEVGVDKGEFFFFFSSFSFFWLISLLVKIHFRAVGSALALRQPVRKLSSTARFEAVVRFLRKQLRLQDHESVFCYVNSVFAPGLDEGIGNLWRVSYSFVDDDLWTRY